MLLPYSKCCGCRVRHGMTLELYINLSLLPALSADRQAAGRPAEAGVSLKHGRCRIGVRHDIGNLYQPVTHACPVCRQAGGR